MTWSINITWADGDTPSASQFNAVSANLDALSTHGHSGADGDGAAVLTSLDHIDFDHQSGLGAPGSGHARHWMESDGTVRTRNTGGSEKTLSSTDHSHDFDLDVEFSQASNQIATGSNNATVLLEDSSDEEVIETSTDTYLESTEVAIAGGAGASHSVARISCRLFFDGVLLQSSSIFGGPGGSNWTMRALSASVSLALGAGGSKVAEVQYRNTGAPAATYKVCGYLSVISFKRN